MRKSGKKHTTTNRSIFRRSPLVTAMLAAMPGAMAQTPGGLEEIVVTAQKREESLQQVPLSITALSNEKLEELGVSDFDRYAKFSPTVSYQTLGPGFARAYMRGVSSGGDGNHSASQPSVAFYLDEQPITTIQGPIDIHFYDMERVETLAGPQGTLFGASSQSGTVRYITRKPTTDGFEAGYDVDAHTVEHGDEGYGVEGFVNIPVGDRVAVRLVAWAEHDAGYIDNVPGTRTFPTSGITIDNTNTQGFDRTEENYNDVNTVGGRGTIRINLNENWTLTPQIMGQIQNYGGTFGYDPLVGNLEVQHYYKEYTDDRWYQAALTVEGKIGNFDLVYAGAYLDRVDEVQLDYTDYSYFYDACCGYGAYFYDDNGALVNPSQYIQGQDWYEKWSHELRLSSPQDERFRYVVGLFWQKQTHDIEQRYRVDGLADAISVTGWPDTIWLTAQERTDKDYAAFGQFDFDLTDDLTLTGGVRVFRTENSLKGFFGFSAGFSGSTGESQCFSAEAINDGPCLNLDKTVKETSATHKVTLTYHLNDDLLMYGTWSTGFRPGGINRRGSLPPYQADFLTNYELGWKSTWLDGRLRFNGAAFVLNWEDFQFSFLGQQGLTEIRNAAQARIEGIESNIEWQPTDALNLSMGVAWLNPELDEVYCGEVEADGTPITDCAVPQAPKGTKLPSVSRLKANLIARYQFNIGEFESYVQGAVVYQSNAWAELPIADRATLGKQDGYALADFTFGIERGNYGLEFYLDNAFDQRPEIFKTAECAVSVCGPQTYIYTLRPRTFGLKFNQRF